MTSFKLFVLIEIFVENLIEKVIFNTAKNQDQDVQKKDADPKTLGSVIDSNFLFLCFSYA